MDPFEEFEFKPLTEGLGFQQKNKSTAPQEQTRQSQGFNLIDEEPTFKAPLPRKHYTPQIPTSPSTSAVDEILETLQRNRKLDFENSVETKAQLKELKNPTLQQKTQVWKKTAPSMAAGFLDTMLVLAGGLLCMIVMLMVTQVDLLKNLTNPDTEGMIYLSTLSLFATVSLIYMLINRVFMGQTPGEWAYDIRIGTPEMQSTPALTAKLVLRQIIILATGVICLPIISAITGKDIAGILSGTATVKKA